MAEKMYQVDSFDYFNNEIERDFKNLCTETLTKLNRLADNKFTIISRAQSNEIILARQEREIFIICSVSWYAFYTRLSDFYTGYLEGLFISKGVNL